ncbi:MAG TPA: 2-phospho-L-lactate guanylyltransferase [Myxococcota bacterium]|nr:2-phospho-L-lactate guanylyltransferase [Myxococcota bacterium]
MIHALVPVKRLAAAKSRLLPLLGPDGVRALTLAMLTDVVAALRAAPEIGAVGVVTEDEEVARAAHEAGAEAIVLADRGLNPSLETAGARLARDDEALLVVLGDVAGLTPDDVAALCDALRALGGRGVVLAPANDGGSAALLRAPRQVIPARFGAASAAAHRALAVEGGVPYREVHRPGLLLDLDCEDDVRAFLARGDGGARTRAALAALLAAPRASSQARRTS